MLNLSIASQYWLVSSNNMESKVWLKLCFLSNTQSQTRYAIVTQRGPNIHRDFYEYLKKKKKLSAFVYLS